MYTYVYIVVRVSLWKVVCCNNLYTSDNVHKTGVKWFTKLAKTSTDGQKSDILKAQKKRDCGRLVRYNGKAMSRWKSDEQCIITAWHYLGEFFKWCFLTERCGIFFFFFWRRLCTRIF